MKKYCMEFFRCASLSVLGMLGLSCYILADTYFISARLGAEGLAALNLALPVYNLIHGCGLMTGMGGAALHSLAMSRNDAARGSMVFTHALAAGGILSLLFFLLGVFAADAITSMLGADDAAFAMSRTYLRMLLLCAPFFISNDILLGFVRSDGAPRLAMTAMLTGSFANILLDCLFIFPLNLGMFGAVFATCLAPLISILVMSLHFLRRRNSFRPVRPRADRALTGKLLAAGFPSLVTEFSSGIVIAAFNFLMLRTAGNLGVAAYGVTANISLVVIAVFTGIGQGGQPVLSRHYGCGEQKKLRAVLRCAFVSTAVLALLLFAAILAAAPWIASVFNARNDPQLQSLAVQGLRLYFIGAPAAGLNILLSLYFACTDAPQYGTLLSLLRGFFLILPAAFLLSALLGTTGIWLAFPAAEGLTFLAALLLYRLDGWRKTE